MSTTPIRQRQRPSPQNEPSATPVAAPAPAQVSGHEGVILVHRARYEGRRIVSEVEREEKISVPFFGTHAAEIEVEGSVTRNLGDFNSARVAVRVKLPAYPELSELDRTYMLASNLVDRYVERELNIATGQADPSEPLPEI